MGCDDVVQVLGLLHLVPKFIPRTFQHLGNNHTTLRDEACLPGIASLTKQATRKPETRHIKLTSKDAPHSPQT